MFFKSKKLVALDIGSSSIKLAEIDINRKNATISNFGQWPTPSNSITSGEIMDMDSLSVAIRSLIDESRCKRKQVATGMWGTSVIVKRISIPRIETNMIAEQIRWEAEQYIPFDVNEISLDFHVLPESDSAETMDVLLIAAKQDLVFQFAELISSSGLTPSIVDVSGFALANCFEMNYGQTQSDVVALLNIGAGVTNFVVVDNGQLVFSRDIPVGGATYTNEIHREMGVSIEEAEALKLSASAQMEVPDEVHSLLTNVNETVAEEIQNSFEFFSATSSGATISKVFFSGGCISVPNLMTQISNTVKKPSEVLDPFLNFQLKLNSKAFPPDAIDAIKPFAAIVVGLGLRQMGDSK